VQLNLSDGDNYESYNAALETIEGREVLRRGPLKARATRGGRKAIVLTIPASALQTGGYILRLSGVNPRTEPEVVADYYFSVERK
jgi:hypothetical protein